VSATQINAVAPQRLSSATPRIQVSFQSATADFTASTIAANPQVFQLPDGTAAAINQDGSINSAEHPALPGSVVAIWATGIGSVPFGFWEDGQLSTGAAALDCCRIVANSPVSIAYSGAAPGIVAGVVQVNFQVTKQLAAQGSIASIALASGEANSNPVKIYLRVPLD